MPIHTQCPQCGTPYTLADQQAGKKVRCRQCQSVFLVSAGGLPRKATGPVEVEVVDRPASRPRPRPAPPPAVSVRRVAPAQPPRRRRDDYDDYDDRDDDRRPRRRRRRRQEASGARWIILGAVGAMLLLFVAGAITFVVIMRKADKGDTTPVAVTPTPVQNTQSSIPSKLGGPAENQDPPPVKEAPVESAPTDAGAGAKPIEAEPVPDVSSTPSRPKRPSEEDVAAAPAPHDGTMSREARARVKKATVLIEVTTANDKRATGSGFFGVPGATGLVLTNAHVVGMLTPDSQPPKSVDVVVNSGEADERKLSASVASVDRSSDLAILDVGSVSGLPTPLHVKSARGLAELDRVYTFGFPLGKKLGKEITIRESSVSSLRKKHGELHRIQIQGGLDPGNSGGPVVDAAGQVVGVAVSGIEGRLINFAIPGDHVRGVLDGRVAAMGIQQSYYTDDGRIAFPVVMDMVDPRKQVREVALDVWTGKAPAEGGGLRPPSDSQPPPEPGDSRRQRYKLPYTGTTARGEVVLPKKTDGQVYWVQPTWVSGSAGSRWAAASVWAPTADNQPVYRKASRLALRTLTGKQKSRELVLSLNNSLRITVADDDEDAGLWQAQTRVTFDEQTQQRAGAGAVWNLIYRDASRFLTEDNKKEPDPMIGVLRQQRLLPGMQAQLTLDPYGSVMGDLLDQRVQTLAQSRSPLAQNRVQTIQGFHEPIQQALRSLAVLLPARQVQPRQSWSAGRPVFFESPKEFVPGQMQVVYTYVGQRKRDGRDEAVLTIQGSVHAAGPTGAPAIGKATGTALVDLATGQVTLSKLHATIDVEFEVQTDKGEKVKIRLILAQEARMERRL
jgi:predicted Zn finger-like uncharacterized protein